MGDSVTVHKAFKFKLNATPQQEQQFRHYAGAVRWVYNHMLAQRNVAFHSGLQVPTTHEQIKQLPGLKHQAETAWLHTIHSQVLQNAVLDLEDAFRRFFNKQNRAPTFKKKHGQRQSFTYPQGVKVEGNRVWLPKLGWVAFRCSAKSKRYREIVGSIKRATISHKASGWYISILTEQQVEAPQLVPVTQANSIGIDLGSIDLVTTSRGEKITNSRHYRALERKLKRAQRALSRKQRGSHNHRKQQQRVAALHEQIVNRRMDGLHRISRRLVDENQAIMCEDLNVRGIAKGLGKSVGDAAWGELVRQLKYKTAWAGKRVVQVGRYFPSSKLCSACGHKHSELARSAREWRCPGCGAAHDRDVNAAINIHREGLKYVAAGLSETQNACGQMVRPRQAKLAQRARLGEASISRL